MKLHGGSEYACWINDSEVDESCVAWMEPEAGEGNPGRGKRIMCVITIEHRDVLTEWLEWDGPVVQYRMDYRSQLRDSVLNANALLCTTSEHMGQAATSGCSISLWSLFMYMDCQVFWITVIRHFWINSHPTAINDSRGQQHLDYCPIHIFQTHTPRKCIAKPWFRRIFRRVTQIHL